MPKKSNKINDSNNIAHFKISFFSKFILKFPDFFFKSDTWSTRPESNPSF